MSIPHIAVPFKASEGRRLLYRFMGTKEYNDWYTLVQQTEWTKEIAIKADQALKMAMVTMLMDPSFGAKLYDFTMAARGGGRNGKFLATTSDLNKLLCSTDDAVQNIIQGAEYVMIFSVPKEACIDGASDLSKSEGEVLVPNLPKALCYMVWKKSTNPYNREQKHS